MVAPPSALIHHHKTGLPSASAVEDQGVRVLTAEVDEAPIY